MWFIPTKINLGKKIKTKLASYKLAIRERKIKQFFDTRFIFNKTINCTYQYLLYWKYRPNKFLRGKRWHNWFMQWQDQVDTSMIKALKIVIHITRLNDNQICSLSKGERLRANERQHYSLHKIWVHKLPLSHTHTHMEWNIEPSYINRVGNTPKKSSQVET